MKSDFHSKQLVQKESIQFGEILLTMTPNVIYVRPVPTLATVL